ncbi:hypothetical protein MMC07_008818 [Pseudocyphellaria aurata]|nr:hypothetical protein [Pseudocyphellaria aurata]
MTLYASDGLDIVMMENFKGLTTNVDCKGDNGSMSLTFKSEQAFDQALNKWNFINKAEQEQFLLIANHDGCGPDDERQPYRITNIQEDRSTLTTFLTAQVAPWSEVARDFDLDFGKVVVRPISSRRVKSRAFWDWNITKTVAFPINVGQRGVISNIVDDKASHIKIDCINCFLEGKVQATGHLNVRGFSIQYFVIESSPQDVKAELKLEATISASQNISFINRDKKLADFPIPGAGIAVTGLFKLGASISYSVGASSSFKGEAVVDFGLAASLPNSAKVTADVFNTRGGSSAVGFNETKFDSKIDFQKLSASISLVAYSKAKISFGIDVTTIGKLDVAVTLQVPKVTTTLTVEHNEQGVCSNDTGASKNGVKINSQVALEVDFDLDANLGSKSSPAKSFPLFTLGPYPLYANCSPITISGSSPVPTLSSASASASGLPSEIEFGIPISIPTGEIEILPPESLSLIYLTAPTGQPSSAPVPSGLRPRGNFRGP